MDSNSNEIYANFVSQTKPAKGQPIRPVCGMGGLPEISSVYEGKTYYFCEPDHKEEFDASPADFVKTT